MTAYLVFFFFAFALGSTIGSFLNVVAYRLPQGMSLSTPPSHCPYCNHAIPIYYNVPVFGWLVLRGKCRHCRCSISARYPIVEAILGIISVGLAWQYGFDGKYLGMLFFASLLAAAALIDFDTMEIPDRISIGGIALGLAGSAFFSWTPLSLAVTGAAIAFLGSLLFVLILDFILKRPTMGGGDIKLLAMIGAFVGPYPLGFIIIASAVIGLVFALMNRNKENQEFPFGPSIVLATLVYIIFLPPTDMWGLYPFLAP